MVLMDGHTLLCQQLTLYCVDIQHKYLTSTVIPCRSLIGEWSIVMSLLVCLSVCLSTSIQCTLGNTLHFFCMLPVAMVIHHLAALQFMYLQFCG